MPDIKINLTIFEVDTPDLCEALEGLTKYEKGRLVRALLAEGWKSRLGTNDAAGATGAKQGGPSRTDPRFQVVAGKGRNAQTSQEANAAPTLEGLPDFEDADPSRFFIEAVA